MINFLKLALTWRCFYQLEKRDSLSSSLKDGGHTGPYHKEGGHTPYLKEGGHTPYLSAKEAGLHTPFLGGVHQAQTLGLHQATLEPIKLKDEDLATQDRIKDW